MKPTLSCMVCCDAEDDVWTAERRTARRETGYAAEAIEPYDWSSPLPFARRPPAPAEKLPE